MGTGEKGFRPMVSSDLPRDNAFEPTASSESPLQRASKPPTDDASGRPEEGAKPIGPPRLILCEQSGVWTPAMLRAEPNVRKYWKRFSRWPAALETFQARRGSFLVVELWPDNLAEILTALRWLDSFAPENRLAVAADRQWAELEWMFRQAGAVHFTTSPREVGPLVQMAIRHLQRANRPPARLTNRIWRRLPWPKAANK